MKDNQPVYVNGDRQSQGHEPDPEVLPRAKRRQFSAEYKLRILTEADECTKRGSIGALLRREGLYSSHLDKWRKQRDRGALVGLGGQKRGAQAKPADSRDRTIGAGERAVAFPPRAGRTDHRRTKKLAELLGTMSVKTPNSETSS